MLLKLKGGGRQKLDLMSKKKTKFTTMCVTIQYPQIHMTENKHTGDK